MKKTVKTLQAASGNGYRAMVNLFEGVGVSAGTVSSR